MFQDVDKEMLFGYSFESPHASHDQLKTHMPTLGDCVADSVEEEEF